MSARKIRKQLATIEQMPHGAARTAVTEELVRLIEADGPAKYLPAALLELVEAYTFTDQGQKAFVAFSHVLREWDNHPEYFEEVHTHILFWSFKWISESLSEYPEISATAAQALLADMERRYALAGIANSAVRMSQFDWAWHTGAADTEQRRLAWISTPGDQMNDCPACVIGKQVDYFVETGRNQEAYDLGLRQFDYCNLEPMRTYTATALAALRIGNAEDAAQFHHKAQALLNSDTKDLAPARGKEFEFLAHSGNLDRALAMLATDAHRLLTKASSTLAQFRLLISVIRGLTPHLEAAGDLATGLRDEQWATIADLVHWARTKASELAKPFDTRNQNTYFADQVVAAGQVTELGVEVELETRAQKQARALLEADSLNAGSQSDAAPSEAAGPESGAPEAGGARKSGHEHDQAADDHFEEDRVEEAAQEFLLASQAFEADGDLVQAGLKLADAAQCCSLMNDERAACDFYNGAIARLQAGGASIEAISNVIQVWERSSEAINAGAGLIAPAISVLQTPAVTPPPGSDPDYAAIMVSSDRAARGGIYAVLCRALATTPAENWPAETQSTENQASGVDVASIIEQANAVAQELPALDQYFYSAMLFHALGSLQRSQGDSASAVWSLESAFEGFELIDDDRARNQVATELIDLLQELGQTERASAITAKLL